MSFNPLHEGTKKERLRKRGRLCSTKIKMIEKDLSLGDIKLNLNKTTPDEIIAEDSRRWRSLVKDIIAVYR